MCSIPAATPSHVTCAFSLSFGSLGSRTDASSEPSMPAPFTMRRATTRAVEITPSSRSGAYVNDPRKSSMSASMGGAAAICPWTQACLHAMREMSMRNPLASGSAGVGGVGWRGAKVFASWSWPFSSVSRRTSSVSIDATDSFTVRGSFLPKSADSTTSRVCDADAHALGDEDGLARRVLDREVGPREAEDAELPEPVDADAALERRREERVDLVHGELSPRRRVHVHEHPADEGEGEHDERSERRGDPAQGPHQ